MSQDTKIEISNAKLYLTAATLFFLMAGCFCAGVTYEKINSRFNFHELPLKSGGIALVVPNKWQVVTEWDKHGRPYIKPSDQ